MTATRGRFITLEGGEGVGKSTQLALLAARLGACGYEVVTTREPGGTEGAETIRALLLGGEAGRWSARSEALLFAAARCDHVERVIAPALERGAWVVCDRYVDSSCAYQSAAGSIDADAVAELHRLGARLMPDRTLVLTLPREIAAERARRRDGALPDRIGGRDAAFFAHVERYFVELARAEPERVRSVSAAGPAEDVAERLLRELADLLC